MAADDRTEEPTGKRLSEARNKGQVIKSIELNTAFVLLVGSALLSGPGVILYQRLTELFTRTLNHLPKSLPTETFLRDLIITDILLIAPYYGLIVLGLLGTGITLTLVQTGFLWAKDRIKPDFKRLNPLTGLKRLVSANGLFELLKALLKLIIVGWVAYNFIREHFLAIVGLGQMDFSSALISWTGMIFALMTRVGMTYMILAIADYLYQWYQNKQSLKMTKEEVKDENKQAEGNPQIKAAIRAKQRRLAIMRMMSKVPKADVVITNPTHLAVAIQYDTKKMNAPLVVAKGAYRMAERIVNVAKEHQVPVIQNIPLARTLYNNVDIEEEIPPELYIALAEVLAYVYRIKDKSL